MGVLIPIVVEPLLTASKALSTLHDGSSGFVVQSTGGVGSVGLHDASAGVVLQSIGGSPGGFGIFAHSGEVDPCSHVGGGRGGGAIRVGLGSSIGSEGVLGSSIVGLLSVSRCCGRRSRCCTV